MAEKKSRKRKSNPTLETVRAVGLAVLLALGIRSFVVEPFKIPSGSMIPTLLVGDYIIVNKFSYGIRDPFKGSLLIPMDEPRRGDVIVFRFPDDERQDFIKRVVGVPGDTIEIRDDRLWINGQLVDQVPEGEYTYRDYARGSEVARHRFREINPDGVEYTVLRKPGSRHRVRGPWVVPPDSYFMMGDNRDSSRDSRAWRNTYVDRSQIKGKAVRVHWSWVIGGQDGDRSFLADLVNTLYRVATFEVEEIRWHRIGRRVDGIADWSPNGGPAPAPAGD